MVQFAMSYLSGELQTVLKKYGLKQRDVSAKHEKVTNKKNLGVSKLSRICSGTQTEITSRDLDDLIDAITKSDEERGKLLRARVRDAYDGKYSGLLKIAIKGGASPAARYTPSDTSIDPDVNAAFAYLYGLVPTNPQVAELVVLLARSMGMKG